MPTYSDPFVNVGLSGVEKGLGVMFSNAAA